MKKIAFLILCLTFSMSVSAHQSTTALQNQIVSKALVMKNSQMYTAGNGGILQLIFNVFYKVGSMLSTTVTNDDIPQETETSIEN